MKAKTRTCSTLSVLVVEDYQDGADSLALLLELHDYRVTVARTGQEAMDLAAAERPDIALLDLLLPDVSGWEVARRMRKLTSKGGKRPFLVALTGCGEEADYRRSFEAGIDLHLLKPVDSALLVGVLQRFADFLSS